jgi:hypothetical protein
MTENTKSWRDVIKVHAAADMFPLLGADELRALGEDIKKNGCKVPIALWTEAPGSEKFLLDGRNRLDAMEAVGLTPFSVRGDRKARSIGSSRCAVTTAWRAPIPLKFASPSPRTIPSPTLTGSSSP